ncbi:MAG: ABC transporter substrate-binding protein [Spirochaetaceae bacterium]|nr:ABC transporter substrate-binding protein [Spirochaetaceae bacterium]
MRKVVLVTLILVTVLITACKKQEAAGGQQQAETKTKIALWHSMGGRNGEALTRLINDFNAAQHTIELEGQFQGSYDDAIAKLKTLDKGAGPDIMQLYDIGTRWAIDSGYTLRMQDFIDKDNYDISDYEANILAYYRMNGVLHSMPFNSSSPVIIYNKEALARAGLDPKTAFATMEDCLAAGRAIEAANPGMKGCFTNYSWVFEQLVSIQDRDLLDKGNGRQGRATEVVGGEALLNIFSKLRSIYSDSSHQVFGKGGAESQKQFAAGALGYFVESCAIYAGATAAAEGKFTVGFAPLPRVNRDDTGGTSVGGGSLWIMDNASTQKADAAWEFIKYATGAEQQAKWSMGTGYLPIRRSAVNLAEYQDFLKNTNPELIVAIESLRNSKPSCAGSVMGVFPKARVIIENEVEIMANDPRVGPQQVVDRIVAQINDEIALYNRTN